MSDLQCKQILLACLRKKPLKHLPINTKASDLLTLASCLTNIQMKQDATQSTGLHVTQIQTQEALIKHTPTMKENSFQLTHRSVKEMGQQI